MDFTERVQRRHVRFHQSGLSYHIISKTNNGAFFLAPKRGVRELCAGVLAKGQQKYPHLKLYGFAFMSNHIHLMVSGSSFDIPEFMGFIKREISRRIGIKYDLKGPKWQKRYTSTALPTVESQEECLRYILSQGVKENLVANPCHWPGLHCAKALLHRETTVGDWFNSTAYKIAKRNHERAKAKDGRRVRKSDFHESLPVKLSPISAWRSKSPDARQKRISAMIDDLCKRAAKKRKLTGTKILGVKKVIQSPISQRVTPPQPPWWQERRRQITAWAKLSDKLTQKYLQVYWEFQKAFRIASERQKTTKKSIFPLGAWAPAKYVSPN